MDLVLGWAQSKLGLDITKSSPNQVGSTLTHTHTHTHTHIYIYIYLTLNKFTYFNFQTKLSNLWRYQIVCGCDFVVICNVAYRQKYMHKKYKVHVAIYVKNSIFYFLSDQHRRAWFYRPSQCILVLAPALPFDNCDQCLSSNRS